VIKTCNIKYLNLLVALICSATFVSCKKDTLQKVASEEITSRPAEEIKNLKILRTVNGDIRNEISAATAILYKENDTALYVFPNRFYVNSYENYKLSSDLVADSASFKEDPGFFTAVGNVVMRDIPSKQRLETQGPFYWNLAKDSLVTFVYTVIYRADDTIVAKDGLLSDSKFTDILLRNHSGVIFHEFEQTSADSVKSEANR